MNRSIRSLAAGASAYVWESARSAKAGYHATLLREEYRSRRRHYEVSKQNIEDAYDDDSARERTMLRLRRSGLARTNRTRGAVHTLAFLQLQGWHYQLLPHLASLGRLSHFHSESDGPSSALLTGSSAAIEHRRRVCESFERYAADVVAQQPVDWVFVYAPNAELLIGTIERIRVLTNAPVVGMSFDDKQSWQGPMVDGQNYGQVALAHHLDLAWTSSRLACDWYIAEGGNPIYLPEGCDPDLFSPAGEGEEFDLCFVGQAYGFRMAFVSRLRALGLRIHTAGPGWPEGPVTEGELVRLFRRSKVVLGHGGIGWSEDLKNIKGRDFDGPAVGMAPYLTSFSPELADCYDIGREVLCYSCVDECYEVARRLLGDRNLRRRIGKAGRERCLRDHTWLHRFERILGTLGILS